MKRTLGGTYANNLNISLFRADRLDTAADWRVLLEYLRSTLSQNRRARHLGCWGATGGGRGREWRSAVRLLVMMMCVWQPSWLSVLAIARGGRYRSSRASLSSPALDVRLMNALLECSKMHFQDKGWRDWVFPQSNQQHGDAHRPGLVGARQIKDAGSRSNEGSFFDNQKRGTSAKPQSLHGSSHGRGRGTCSFLPPSHRASQ